MPNNVHSAPLHPIMASAALAGLALFVWLESIARQTADFHMAFAALGAASATALIVAGTTQHRGVMLLAALSLVAVSGWEGYRLADTTSIAIQTQDKNSVYPLTLLNSEHPSRFTVREWGDRRALHKSVETYDQIELRIPFSRSINDWLTDYLYTRDAFRDYWFHLKPGGVLTVLVADEMPYLRTLLTAWEILREDPAGGSDTLVQQAWGYRAPDNAMLWPQHYLLILVKGPLAPDTSERVHTLAGEKGLTPLFGPDIPPGAVNDVRIDPYNILYHPEGITIARTALGMAANWHFKNETDIRVVNDNRPFFRHFVSEPPPPLKWLLGACLGLLAMVLLFPLKEMRGISSPCAAILPPLPAYLGYFASLAGVTLFATTALAFQSALLTGSAGVALPLVWCSFVAGMVLAARFVMKKYRCAEYAGMAAVALLAITPWLLDLAPGENWPLIARLAIIALFALTIGFLSGMLFREGLRLIPEPFSAAAPWAWIAAALTAACSPIATLWLAQAWGWKTAWPMSAAVLALVLALGFWLRWPLEKQSPGGTKEKPL